MSGDHCGARLLHTHGTTRCDLEEGHEGRHGGYCSLCLEDGHNDPSDRLDWDRDGEDWCIPAERRPRP